MGPQLQRLGREGLYEFIKRLHGQRAIIRYSCFIRLVVVGQVLFDRLAFGVQQRFMMLEQLFDLDGQVAG
ncbi:hypothetical protein D3C85_1679190 [compost metagenome]